MKNIIFTSLLILSSITLAETTEFKVISAQFNVSHSGNPGKASVTVDTKKSQVRLFVEQGYYCPPKMMCAQYMPTPLVVELPIISIKTDTCGIQTIIAKKDARPVDGSLEILTIKDASKMTCKTFVAVNSEAQYETSYADRRTQKTISATSKMILELISAKKSEAQTLIKFQQNPGFMLKPFTHVVIIDDTGKVTSLVSSFSDKSQTVTEIAQLSAKALKNLKAQLALVNENNQLIDENENQPKCMDAPSQNVTILKNLKEVEIYKWENCHSFKSEDSRLQSLTQLMLGFVNLTE